MRVPRVLVGVGMHGAGRREGEIENEVENASEIAIDIAIGTALGVVTLESSAVGVNGGAPI